MGKEKTFSNGSLESMQDERRNVLQEIKGIPSDEIKIVCYKLSKDTHFIKA